MVQNKQNTLFCLFCTIQHYSNTFFWPQLHYFVYTLPFNITTPLFGLLVQNKQNSEVVAKKGNVVMLNGTE
jgi:hypothetical protein